MATTEPLSVQLLGPVRCRRGDQEVTLGSPHSRAVFAMLATRSGRVVPRYELVEGVWGAAPPPHAVRQIHTYVSTLRSVLDPDRRKWSPGSVLLTTGAGYSIGALGDRLDVNRFAANAARAQGHLARREFALAFDACSAALDLWRGEALCDVQGQFADALRAHTSEQCLTVEEWRAEAGLGCGRFADAVSSLKALTADHPLRERARALLMLALHRSGRSAEALELYATTRAMLTRTFGIEPGAALRDAHAEVLGGKDEVGRSPGLAGVLGGAA